MPQSIHTAQYKVLRNALIAARKASGLTQSALAERLMVTQSFVAKVELGERRIDVIEFLNITRAIGADPVEIIRMVDSVQE